MMAEEKLNTFWLAECLGLSKDEILKRFEVLASTFYWRQCKFRLSWRLGLSGVKTRRGPNWNQRSDDECESILETATLYPEVSCREIVCKIMDHCRFRVSEPTVYYILF